MQRRVAFFVHSSPLSRSSLSRRPRSRTASTPSRRRRRSSPRIGPHDIGVRTIQVTDKNRPDILNIKEGGPIVRYDRTLTLEVWYPAALAAGQKPGGEYRVITRDPAVMATLSWQGGSRCRASPRLRRAGPGSACRLPARDHFARLPGQSFPDEPHRREPREQGLRHACRSITRTAPTTIRRRSAARSTTARSISCSC